jgi:hypothetical protein
MALTRPRYSTIIDTDWKSSVRVATTGSNITLSGGAPSTLDGVSLVAGNRVLVKDQSSPNENGIYVVSVLGQGSNGTWVRSFDANANLSVTSGQVVPVTEGTQNGGHIYLLSTPNPITLDTTGLTYVSAGFNSAGINTITNTNVSTSTTSGALTVAGGVGIGGDIYVGGNANISGNSNVGNLTTPGSITASNTVTGGNLSTRGTLSVTGNANVGNLGTAGVLLVTGNANVGNLGTAGLVVATGNVTGGNLVTSGALSVTSNANVGNLGTAGLIVATGNVSGGNINTAANVLAGNVNVNSQVYVSGTTDSSGLNTGALNVAGGASISKNLYVGGNLYVTNLISSSNITLNITNPLLYLNSSSTYPYSYDIGFYSHFSVSGPPPGNGYQHTGFVRDYNTNTWFLFSNASEPSAGIITFDSNTVYDDIKVGNITSTGTANIVGNANIGNLGTAGLIVATGNITGGNLVTGGALSVTGNANTGNLGTSGILSVTGNANVGNLGTTGLIVATGNITGGNIATAGELKSTGTFVIGSQQFYPHGSNGFSVNENFDAGSSTETAYHFTSGAGRGNVVFTTAVSSQFTAGFGATGTAASPKFVTFGESGNVVFEWRKSTGISPVNLTGGTLLANISPAGDQWVLGNVTGGNLVTGGTLSVTGNANTGNLGTGTIIATTANLTTINSALYQNGNSNIAISANGNITLTATSNSTVIVTPTGANVTGYANITSNLLVGGNANIAGNANVGNLGTATAVITTAANVPLIQNGNSNIAITSNANITITSKSNATVVITDTGANISGTANITGNTNLTNLFASIATVNNRSTGVALTVTGVPYQPVGDQTWTFRTSTGIGIPYASWINFPDGTNQYSAYPGSSTDLTLTGNITGGNLVTGGTLSVTGNANVGNLGAGSGSITTTGNIAGGNLSSSGALAVTGNANVANLNYSGNLYQSGNLRYAIRYTASTAPHSSPTLGDWWYDTGSDKVYLRITDGTTPVWLDTTSKPPSLIAGTSNVVVTNNGNIVMGVAGNAQVFTVTGTGANISGTLNATANISGGNLITAGYVSASGNITTTAGYFKGDGGLLTNISASGGTSITNGNSNVIVISNGNVTVSSAGNANIMTITGVGANIAGTLGVTGNITGNYILGNGSQLTGIITTVSNVINGTSNINIASSGSNVTVGVAGNANVLVVSGTGANISGTANITGNANVGNLGTATIIATTANLTTINSGLLQNGTSNVTVNSSGNVNISVGGNVLTVTSTGANISGTANVSGNANVGNLGAATVIATTANLTTINSGLVQNGTSNVTVNSSGNVNISVGGNVLTVTSTGANISGTANISGNANTGNLGTGTIIATTANLTTINGALHQNGNSNINITANSNIVLTAVSNSTMTITGTGANISGTANISGNILAGANIVYTGNLYQGSQLRYALAYTASTAAPSGSTLGDYWYDTATDILYLRVSDGTTPLWFDVSSQANTFSDTTTTNAVITTASITTANVSGNINAANLQNGNSNVRIVANGNVTVSAIGNANVLTITGTGANIAGTANITGNANVGNLGTTGSITALSITANNTGASGALTARSNYTTTPASYDAGIVVSLLNNTYLAGASFGAADLRFLDIGIGPGPQTYLRPAGSNGLAIVSGMTVTGSILPSANATYSLGATGSRWSNIWGLASSAQYADLAERYASDDGYDPGTVVIFGGAAEITVTTVDHDPRIAGVISTEPGYLMNDHADQDELMLPVALQGRVPTLVRGPIRKGDMVVSSGEPGVGIKMKKALYEPGCVIGKSLENIDDDSIHTIEVVVGRL